MNAQELLDKLTALSSPDQKPGVGRLAERRKGKMKDLSWTQFLPEAGSPIRDAVKEIVWRTEQADKALRDARRVHRQQMAEIQRQTTCLEQHIAKLWTPEEIIAAKRGVVSPCAGRNLCT